MSVPVGPLHFCDFLGGAWNDNGIVIQIVCAYAVKQVWFGAIKWQNTHSEKIDLRPWLCGLKHVFYQSTEPLWFYRIVVWLSWLEQAIFPNGQARLKAILLALLSFTCCISHITTRLSTQQPHCSILGIECKPIYGIDLQCIVEIVYGLIVFLNPHGHNAFVF